MSGVTDDPNDPRLTRGADDQPTSMAPVYLVLSDAERAAGYVRPVRRTYVHQSPCGAATTMGLAIAQTYARDPGFYGSTWCTGCNKHRPVSEFVWDDGTGATVGS